MCDLLRHESLAGAVAGIASLAASSPVADADKDGLPDLYITMIFDKPMPDLLFRNLGNNTFVDEGVSRHIADFDGGSHGTCWADLDNDGDVDFAVGVKRSRNWLVRNDYTGNNNWLKVKLISPGGQAGARRQGESLSGGCRRQGLGVRPS